MINIAINGLMFKANIPDKIRAPIIVPIPLANARSSERIVVIFERSTVCAESGTQ